MARENGWNAGTSIADLWTTQTTKVDQRLAAVYGGNVTSTAPVVFDLSGVPFRGGFLGTAAVLTVSGKNRDNPSIVGRGRWVKERIFCETVPPPPPGVDTSLPDANTSSTAAADKHQTDPTCKGCHAQIDPIGKGLERYDAIGALRTQYPSGEALPEKGSVPSIPVDFASATELGHIVRDNATAQQCVTRHLWRWMLARDVDPNDAVDSCTLASFHETLQAKNFNLKDALLEYVTSDAFRFRTPVVD